MVAGAGAVKRCPAIARKGRIRFMVSLETTEDSLLDGRIRIRQPARGYRVNADTLLLAAAHPPATIRCDGTRVVEVCCGVGAALLAVAVPYNREGAIEFVGIERDPGLAALARENIVLNGQGHRANIAEADALDLSTDFGLFDYAFFNPPYDTDGEGRAPSDAKRDAYISDRPIGDWIKVWSNRLRAHGELTLIHRAHRLREILDALDGRLGSVRVFPIRPCSDKPARRVIVRARKGSKGPLSLLCGLDLHPTDKDKGKFTPEADAIFRGERHIWMY